MVLVDSGDLFTELIAVSAALVVRPLVAVWAVCRPSAAVGCRDVVALEASRLIELAGVASDPRIGYHFVVAFQPSPVTSAGDQPRSRIGWAVVTARKPADFDAGAIVEMA